MGYTIGDVLTVVSFVFGILFSIWALLVGFSLIFPAKGELARKEIEERPWKSFVVGIVVATVGIFLTIVFLNLHNPVVTLIGWGIGASLFYLAVIGGSGLAIFVGNRITDLERRRGRYKAIERGALLLVAGAVLPLFGWFAFTPVVFLISIGAGFRSMVLGRRRKQRMTESASVNVGYTGVFVL